MNVVASVFLADGEPVTLPSRREPWALTDGTPIMFPEEGPHAGRGPHAGQGVVERMAVFRSGQEASS